ncbi:alpha/beta hydrolase [Paenibacillus sp. LHD-38]|uniref:alpha/beta fold hydrolase n=1 Tax=Paenibacillus sp. LHD-38 TaxID=3072143 RepID=UPI00280FE482|nr:alpha/beta hydrolase [Paenibacillus sp. LHD-38]MDQ8734610.1 alpha/beta hydrolase [Paenibacillus sp. LHD-38]
MNNHAYAQEKTGFVFIHGAGLNREIWSKVLEGFGHPYLLIDFPNREEQRGELALADYVMHIKKQIDEWGTRRVIIVAHSLGGVLSLKLAAELNDRLAGFVAVGAVIPKKGGSFLSVLPLPKRILMSLILRKMGTKPPESAIRTGLCNDLTDEQASKIVITFKPESVRVYTDRADAPAPAVPKLYVKLSKDKELSPSLQNKMISHFAPQSVQSLDTGHLPMLSDPAGLRLLLLNFIARIET